MWGLVSTSTLLQTAHSNQWGFHWDMGLRMKTFGRPLEDVWGYDLNVGKG